MSKTDKDSDSSTNMSKLKIILVDSTSSIDKIKKMVKNQRNFKIITFDYNSHKYLSKNKIIHKISDDFLNEDELQEIHDESFNLTKWYEGEFSDSLQFENINLGRVFYVEFHHFLLPFLKKVFEIKKIVEELSNVEFIASSRLFDIVKNFNSSVTYLDEDKKLYEDFLDDSIRLRITDSMKLNISRNSYQKLKKSSEKIISNITTNEIEDGKKSVLFIEFNPIKYEKLLETSKEHSLNFVLFNRRQPSIWNLGSYKIIKKSNCIIAKANDVMNADVIKKIEKDQESLIKDIEVFWKNEKFFETFFIFKGISFWSIIKPIFLRLCTSRMIEAVREINITKRVLEKFNISSVVCWSENGFNEQIAIGMSKKLDKKVILLQHGLYVDSINSVSQNKFSGVLPTNSDKFLVWGNVLADYAKNIGIPNNMIKVIGSPSYDSIFDNKDKGKYKKHILIATTSTSNKIGDFLVKNRENYEDTILSICKTLKKMKKEIVIKVHPFEEEEHVTQLIKEFDSKIKVIKKGNIVSLIKSCEVFISLDISTTILEAQIINKPVISITTGKIPYNDESTIFTSDSCVKVEIQDFENEIKKILQDKDYNSNVIKKGSDFLNKYVSNQGAASSAFLSFLEKF